MVSNAAVFGYLWFGMPAVGYVATASLCVVSGWAAYRLCVEFWEELSYRYHREKALNEWARNKRRLS